MSTVSYSGLLNDKRRVQLIQFARKRCTEIKILKKRLFAECTVVVQNDRLNIERLLYVWTFINVMELIEGRPEYDHID